MIYLISLKMQVTILFAATIKKIHVCTLSF